MTPLEITDAVVTALLALAGLWAANSYGRHRRLRLSEDRLSPYGALWAATELTKSSRISEERPLSPQEAASQVEELRTWYYAEHGGAMVLPIPTLKMLLLILGDLQRLADRRPEDAEDAEGEHEGYALLVAISLLRTQLKIDLDVYDVDERAQLTLRSPSAPVDVVAIRLRFLRRACVDVEHWGRPDRWWRPRSFHWHHYASSSLPRDDIVSVGAACQEVTDQDRAAAAS